MKTVYVVRGSSGSYGDHQEWNVRVFASRSKAEHHAAAALARAKWLLDWRDADDEGVAFSKAKNAPKKPWSRFDRALDLYKLNNDIRYGVEAIRFDAESAS